MAKISSPSLVDTGQDPGLSYFKTTQENVQVSSKPGISKVTPTPDTTNRWMYEAAISSPSVIDEPSGVAVTPSRPTKSSTSTPTSYIIGSLSGLPIVTEVVNNFINNYIAPAGNTHEIQINEYGAISSDANLTYNPVTDTLTTDTVVAKYISGGLLTNAQPNITSVGILNNLNVADSVVADGFYYSNGMSITSIIGSPPEVNRGVYFGSETITNSLSLVDTIPLDGNTAVRWSLSSFDAINSKYKTSTIDSLNDGANVYHNEYSVIKTDDTAAIIQFTSNISFGNINLWAVGDSPQVEVIFERTVLGSSTKDHIGYLTAGPRGPQGLSGNGRWNGGVVTNLIRVTNTTNSLSTNTGAVVISGGLGVVGNINVKRISAEGFYYPNGISITSNIPGYATQQYVTAAIQNISVSDIGDLASTGDIANAIANVTWTNLIDKPTFANIAISGSYLDLTNTPILFDGDYNNLTNSPVIPTHTSNLTNDSEFVTLSDIPSAKELSFEIKSSNFSAISGSRYGVDTSAEPITCMLPANPISGDAILFVDISFSFGVNEFKLDGNGNNIKYVVNDDSISEPILNSSTSYIIGKSDYLFGSLGTRSWGILWTGSAWTGY